MINKKKNKISQIIVITTAILCIFALLSIFSTSLAYEAKDIYTPSASGISSITSRAGKILWIVMAIGMATGTCMIAYIGIKFIISSPEGKAEIKKQAFAFVFGAFLLMSGSLVISVIANMAYSIN